MMYLIEYMTIRTWIIHIVPHLLTVKRNSSADECLVYFVDCSILFKLAYYFILSRTGNNIKKLIFSVGSIRDECRRSIQLKLTYSELERVQQLATADPILKEIIKSLSTHNSVSTFLEKSITPIEEGRMSLWLSLIHI